MAVEEGGRWSTADNVFLIHHTGRGYFYSASPFPQGCVYETRHASDRASTHANTDSFPLSASTYDNHHLTEVLILLGHLTVQQQMGLFYGIKAAYANPSIDW